MLLTLQPDEERRLLSYEAPVRRLVLLKHSPPEIRLNLRSFVVLSWPGPALLDLVQGVAD